MKTKNWYRNSYRRHLIDMHIADWDDQFLAKFDENVYFENLKKAHIQTPMIYLQAHTGLCNWDSKSGRVHRAFHNNNKIKRLIDLCHADGMNVVAYYSLIYNNWAYEQHPEWRMVDYEGRNSRDPEQKDYESSPRYGILCPNSAGYRNFIKEQLAELCDVYDFEGIFLDMTFWPTVCYCDSCRERYRKETAKEIPRRIDWSDPEWLEYQSHREQWLTDFAEYCTKEIKSHKPNAAVEHQFSTVAKDWKFGVTEGIGNASDYCGGDLYGGFAEQSFICKAYYELTKNQPFEFMTSRCEPTLTDHTTTKSLDALKVHNFLTLAHHGAFLAIDAINLDGTMDPYVYETLGKVFECTEPYEPYLDQGTLKTDTAIYFSLRSKMDATDAAENYGTASHSSEELQSALGAAASFAQHHLPYTVLSNNSLARIQNKQVLILTNTTFVSDEERDTLTDFVANGGGLYLSGTTDFKLVERLLGLRFEKYTDETVAYVAPTEEGRPYFGKQFRREAPLCVMRKHPLCTGGKEGNVVLATLTLPGTLPSAVDIFCSIHSNPPRIATDYPSVVKGTYGKGSVIWSGGAIEKNTQKAHKDVFYSFIDSLRTKPVFLKTNAPSFVEITVFENGTCDYINCVNCDDHEPMLDCGSVEITYAVPKHVKSVEVLPSEKVVPFEQNEGSVSFTATEIHPFRMYRINYDD